MKANETDKYKKSCIKMIMEFPKISKLLTQKNYIVPKTPNKVCSGYWNEEYIDTIAREVGLDNYLQMYDNNVNIMENMFIQCIELLREFHENMVIHCDIKPDNIMVSDNRLYIIDFGLSQFYIEDDDKDTERKTQINGTPRYVSPFIHQGFNYLPKDDIISLCYVFYELYTPLPWDSRGFVNDIQHEKNKELCLNKIRCIQTKTDVPFLIHIINILKYCYTLDDDKQIDYDLLLQRV